MASQVEGIKWIQGTRFMVDGFRFQNSRCQNYFLTHFHSDHMTGLTRNFTAGLIYCSPVTAVLLKKDMGMPPEHIMPLPLDQPISIDGVTVTPIDANHCPGAVMFLFHVPARQGTPAQLILHTGDLRWHSGMAEHPAIRDRPLDVLYLDTTYALPKHVHPHQDVAIAQIIDVMRKSVKEEPRTLFVVGAYHIGKERAFLGAAKALQWPVWVNPDKLRVLGMLDLPASDLKLLTTKEAEARIHVVFMGQGLLPDALEKRMNASGDWARVVAFRPTGWSYRKNGLETRRQGPVTIYGVPYSEHSSFPELRDCVKLLRPKRLVPTVNAGNPTASRRVADRFADLMDLSGDRSRLDMYFAGLQQRVARNSQMHSSSGCASSQTAVCDDGHPFFPLSSTPLPSGQPQPLIKAESTPPLQRSHSDCHDRSVSLIKAESSPAGLNPGSQAQKAQAPLPRSCQEQMWAGSASPTAGATRVPCQLRVNVQSGHATGAQARPDDCSAAGSRSQAATEADEPKPSQRLHGSTSTSNIAPAGQGGPAGCGNAAGLAESCAARQAPTAVAEPSDLVQADSAQSQRHEQSYPEVQPESLRQPWGTSVAADADTSLTVQHAGMVRQESQIHDTPASNPADACSTLTRASASSSLLLDCPADASKIPDLSPTNPQLPNKQASSWQSTEGGLGSRPAKRSRLCEPKRPKRSSSAQEMAYAQPSDDGMVLLHGAAATDTLAVSESTPVAEVLLGHATDSRQPQRFQSQPLISTGQPSLEGEGDGVTSPKSSCQHPADAATACRPGDHCNGTSSGVQLPAQAASCEGRQHKQLPCLDDSDEPMHTSVSTDCHAPDVQAVTASGSPCCNQETAMEAACMCSKNGAAGLMPAVGAGSEYVDLTLIDPEKQARLLAAIQRESASAASLRASSRTSPMHCRQSGLMKQAKMQAFFSLK